MDTKTLTRGLAVVLVGIAATIAVAGTTSSPAYDEPQTHALTRDRSRSDDLRKLMRYCRSKGELALRNPICLQIWVYNCNHVFATDKDKAAGGLNLALPLPCARKLCDGPKSKPVPRGSSTWPTTGDSLPRQKDKLPTRGIPPTSTQTTPSPYSAAPEYPSAVQPTKQGR